MKRLLSVVVPVLILLSFSVIIFFNETGRAQTQSVGPAAVTPNASGSVAAQTGDEIEARRRLQCQNCHGPGKTLPYLGGSLFHADEHRAYDAGFHARAHQNGGGAGKRAATCADCHTKDGWGDITTRPFLSFRESVHAQAAARGNLGAAVCSDCHRAHDVLPGTDARSPIFKFNVPQTCGQCHPGAGENFTKGKVHLDVPASQDAGSTGVRWVRWFYLPVIFLTIGGMAVHNLLVWRRKAAHKLRHEARTIRRLTKNQRVQHWLLLTSFITLVVTGFALVYPGAWDSYLGLEAEGTRRWVHRVAALVMMGVGVYHLIYLVAVREGRSWVRDMMPKWKDAVDLWQNLLYYAGQRRTRPMLARFGYAEKAEYWAVIWGTLVMGLTGLMIWFKVGWFGFLPRWWIDVAIAVHFYEAVLATLAIVVWHFYQVIFDPEVYPVNLDFYDGRVSEELYREEHGLDFERLQESQGSSEETSARPDLLKGYSITPPRTE